jgi:hypothetical protein
MLITNEKHDDCKGCNYFYDCGIPSIVTYKNKEYKCPCMTCLVKMICEGDGICYEYLEYYDIVSGQSNKSISIYEKMNMLNK